MSGNKRAPKKPADSENSKNFPRPSRIEESRRSQAEMRIHEWYELLQKIALEDYSSGGASNPIEKMRMTAAVATQKSRSTSKTIEFDDGVSVKVPSHMRTHVQAKESRGTRKGTVIPNIERTDHEHWLLFMMTEVRANDARYFTAAEAFAIHPSKEAAWEALECGDKTFLRYLEGALSTIMQLERLRVGGWIDASLWR